ncbi:unnamed protein product [Caenorhabditis auriculariae]|uniref:Protein kinase domain-containing protein n=1 Tax=Caenorhabditis auriculariae TaxID=2777116 RepID=A0A8S1HBR9_9PELO|nr:unnamed protein product [Caenorhabditis auriculariae]
MQRINYETASGRIKRFSADGLTPKANFSPKNDGNSYERPSARCSKRVLDGMCTKMATTSSNMAVAPSTSSSFSDGSDVDENDHVLRRYFAASCDKEEVLPKGLETTHPLTPSSSPNATTTSAAGDFDDSALNMSTCSSSCSTKSHQSSSASPSSSTSSLSQQLHPAVAILGPLYASDDFDVLEPLGEGFFNKVFKVRHKTTGEVLVLKESKSAAVGGCRRAAHADAAREAAIMRRLRNDNVISLRGICISIDELGQWDANLLVSYCDGGSLSRLILDHSRTFSWRQRIRYAHDIASAMAYTHQQKIIHRDLTSMNVLIEHSKDGLDGQWGRAIVADFGLSCPFPKRGEKLAQVGTTYFMSPECLKEEFYDEKSDVFSFGIILCQMIARIDADPDGGLQRTSNFGLDYMLFTPMCPVDTPIELLKLAFRSCVMDPAARLSFTEIQAYLSKILASLPPTVSSPDLQGKESRLGRSRSDAALKRPKGMTRKLSSNPFVVPPSVRTVIEGEEDDKSSVMLMEELARDAARDDPKFVHTNPFQVHERYRKERKIFPRKNSHSSRRRSETKPESSVTRVLTPRKQRRRCMSLPLLAESPSTALSSLGPRCFDSLDGRRRLSRRDTVIIVDPQEDDEDEEDEELAANGSPAGGIPMAFRDFDRKFLKQMKRFPSRRHTLIPECANNNSIHSNKNSSTTPLSRRHKSDDATYNLTPYERKQSPSSQSRASLATLTPAILATPPSAKENLFTAADIRNNEVRTSAKRDLSSEGYTTAPEAVLEKNYSCEERAVDTVVSQTPTSSTRRRLTRVCSATHRNSSDCCIL